MIDTPGSSNISSLDHDNETKTLRVTFRNGAIYHYHGVDESVYKNMQQAKSMGTFLHSMIVPRYKAAKISGPTRESTS